VLGYAIAARKERYPSEEPYRYEPFEAAGLSFDWDDAARQDMHDYNRDDISI
jgi:hypothetical protein